jgi:hypothetical protein
MAIGVQELKRQLFASWTYLDVLALAMAKTSGNRFSADPGKWNQIIADLQARFESEVPELLERVYFDFRKPDMPYSEQVETFFRVMGGAGALSLGNPAFKTYFMSPKAKQDIMNTQGPALQDYNKWIEEIASEIQREMVLPD